MFLLSDLSNRPNMKHYQLFKNQWHFKVKSIILTPPPPLSHTRTHTYTILFEFELKVRQWCWRLRHLLNQYIQTGSSRLFSLTTSIIVENKLFYMHWTSFMINIIRRELDTSVCLYTFWNHPRQTTALWTRNAYNSR